MTLLITYNIFIALTVVMFYFGPIPWPGRYDNLIALYIFINLIAFNIGALLPRGRGQLKLKEFSFYKEKKYAYLIISIFIIASLLMTYNIVGKNPFSSGSYTLDFGKTYQEFGENLKIREVGTAEFILTIVKALFFPFIILIFVDRFGKDWIAVGLIIIPMIISGVLRGTDKEFFDVINMIIITAVYKKMIGKKFFLYAALIPAFLVLFLLRRLGRFDNNLPMCLPDSIACFSSQSFVAKTFGFDAEVLFVFLTNYITQGYQALHYAFFLDFNFNFLLGHMPPVKRSACKIVESLCSVDDYQIKLYEIGWDTTTRWTSAHTILANDFSFFGVPFFFLFMGLVFSKSKYHWNMYKDQMSLASLILVSSFILFSSANFQIAISLDWAMALIFFIYLGTFRNRAKQQ